MKEGTLASAIGAQVRIARSEAGLVADDVARSLSLTPEMFKAAEDGHVKFTAAQLVELCGLLDRMPSWFFKHTTVAPLGDLGEFD